MGRRPRLDRRGKNNSGKTSSVIHIRCIRDGKTEIETSIGEMWIGATQADNSLDKTVQKHDLCHNAIRRPGMRICGSGVDDMCVQLYESNQRSKYYNKIL